MQGKFPAELLKKNNAETNGCGNQPLCDVTRGTDTSPSFRVYTLFQLLALPPQRLPCDLSPSKYRRGLKLPVKPACVKFGNTQGANRGLNVLLLFSLPGYMKLQQQTLLTTHASSVGVFPQFSSSLSHSALLLSDPRYLMYP